MKLFDYRKRDYGNENAGNYLNTIQFTVVPSYIPLERLAAASGIQMVANGILILLMGSFVGKSSTIYHNYKDFN